MISFRSFSIPKKIVAITTLISSAALLLASGILIANDLSSTRGDLTAGATRLAQIVANNASSAVYYNDQTAAAEALESLLVEPSIIASCIYTSEGLFVERVTTGVPPCPKELKLENDDTRQVLVSTPIRQSGKDIGMVQVRATLGPAYQHLLLQVGTMLAVLVVAGLFAFGLSSQLQKLISKPILSLARTANEISRGKDYSIRASKQNEDELGTLVDAFNEMLSQIEKREAALQQRTAELVQASRMKDEFLATLSHELRTPLNSILGWAVLIQQGQLPNDRQKMAFEAIERNARVQARLIEDLLDVSRIISGKFALQFSDVSLKQIVDSAIEVVRPAALAKEIRIQFEVKCTPHRISGDAARLQQVVWNLLSNAVKFSSEYGTVIIELDTRDRHALIAVSDSGVGIPQEFLPYVFDRFRQADASSTRAQGGLGLGLAIVRHIVEMHGGIVRVDSKGKGQGATFTIALPLAADQAAVAESSSSSRRL
jgi:signal transduction histidine kinase